jgi:hypothetical protein
MTPKRTSQTARASENGFLLVGVVMFVLALTILGISLFGLSSYEAQFLQQSQNDSQAFYDASGALDRAKAVLTVTGRLEAVQTSLPVDVDSTIATQNGVTSGPIAWDPSMPVTLRAVGREATQATTLQATFRPQPDNDYYRRLVTVSTGLSFNLTNINLVVTRPQVNFNGEDWQTSPDTSSWSIMGTRPSLSALTGGPPKPDVLTYLADPAHFAAGVLAPMPDANDTYDLKQGAGTIRLFSSPYTGGQFSLKDSYQVPGHHPTISIRDTVIWMFDRGASFLEQVTVDGGPNDCLVMIAHQNFDASQGEPTLALNFGGGLTAPGGCAVILVSDGKVDIEHYGQALHVSDQASYVSIYADSVLVTGPEASNTLTYNHALNKSDPRDQPGGLIDRLASLGYLPGEFSGGGKFAFIPGTWQQRSNPN